MKPKRLLAFLLIIALAAGGVVLSIVVLGKRMPELTSADLRAAVARWQEHGPASYDMDLELGGTRPGVVQVRVRDGEVVAMQRDQYTPRRRETWDVWSVPGQFDMLERELEMSQDPSQEMGAPSGTQWRLRAQFDPQYGYPRGYHRLVMGGGPEVYWRVTKFQPK